MLELKNIKKSYQTGTFVQHALNGVNLKFRKNEFVAILGPSGSGKTTLLNIIGGLDHYDSGDLIINDQSTKKFKDVKWDSYRNNCVGFIFQYYNLISHINILENVEMSMTLSGYSKRKRKKLALDALKKVNLVEHAYKKPNQLSGGQMQRVAIARALVNHPNIILADEPTGALDSKTSIQIMKLIQEISKDKLVIMVTHNPDIAEKYADRIIEFKDGKVMKDSNPYETKVKDKKKVNIKKTAMKYTSALSLSFNNIKTKKWRTFITSFASSIGIIGIALILSLSNGFKIKIDEFEKNSLSQMPITITNQAMSINEEDLNEIVNSKVKKYPEKQEILPKKDEMEMMMHSNIISQEYIDYIEKLDKKYIGGMNYLRTTGLNIVTKDKKENYKLVKTKQDLENGYFYGFEIFPTNVSDRIGIIDANYDVLYGNLDTSTPGLILIVDSKNQISETILDTLGFDSKENISFEEIMNKEFKVIHNNDFYQKNGPIYTMNNDYKKMYQSKNSKSLKIQAILRGKKDKETLTSSSVGIYYTEALVNEIIDNNKESAIVKDQKKNNYNILTTEKFNDSTSKDAVLSYLGDQTVPVGVYIYPTNFDAKEEILSYLDKYNEDKKQEDKIIYTDMASMMSSLTGSIMDAITIVLVAFSSVSLIVSSIMISIITYTSVLERTKEIGILRALGARKKDISRVFNAEVLIIGLCSGLLGIFIALLLTLPINKILYALTGLSGIAKLNPIHALILILINSMLTLIGGLIPAKIASKKDPVIALRTE